VVAGLRPNVKEAKALSSPNNDGRQVLANLAQMKCKWNAKKNRVKSEEVTRLS